MFRCWEPGICVEAANLHPPKFGGSVLLHLAESGLQLFCLLRASLLPAQDTGRIHIKMHAVAVQWLSAHVVFFLVRRPILYNFISLLDFGSGSGFCLQ